MMCSFISCPQNDFRRRGSDAHREPVGDGYSETGSHKDGHQPQITAMIKMLMIA